MVSFARTGATLAAAANAAAQIAIVLKENFLTRIPNAPLSVLAIRSGLTTHLRKQEQETIRDPTKHDAALYCQITYCRIMFFIIRKCFIDM
jgi:hypothetical protein